MDNFFATSPAQCCKFAAICLGLRKCILKMYMILAMVTFCKKEPPGVKSERGMSFGQIASQVIEWTKYYYYFVGSQSGSGELVNRTKHFFHNCVDDEHKQMQLRVFLSLIHSFSPFDVDVDANAFQAFVNIYMTDVHFFIRTFQPDDSWALTMTLYSSFSWSLLSIFHRREGEGEGSKTAKPQCNEYREKLHVVNKYGESSWETKSILGPWQLEKARNEEPNEILMTNTPWKKWVRASSGPAGKV